MPRVERVGQNVQPFDQAHVRFGERSHEVALDAVDVLDAARASLDLREMLKSSVAHGPFATMSSALRSQKPGSHLAGHDGILPVGSQDGAASRHPEAHDERLAFDEVARVREGSRPSRQNLAVVEPRDTGVEAAQDGTPFLQRDSVEQGQALDWCIDGVRFVMAHGISAPRIIF